MKLEPRRRGVLDSPPEPVIGLAEGETRWRGMTAELVEPARDRTEKLLICPTSQIGLLIGSLRSFCNKIRLGRT